MSTFRLCLAAALLATHTATAGATESRPDPLAGLDAAIGLAERSLHAGDAQVAESRYRAALLHGWILLGSLDAIDGQLVQARTAFENAVAAAVDNRPALHSLAGIYLRMGEAGKTAAILGQLADQDPKDIETRRLLAQALIALGQPEQAVGRLEEAVALAPTDLELTYALATGYLHQKKPEDAARLFTRMLRARPIPQTQILIGRAYREVGDGERARVALRAALEQGPRVRGAHYYLGLLSLDEQDSGPNKQQEAASEFRAELKVAPGDPATSSQLGAVLVETRQLEEALPALTTAVQSGAPAARTYYYLGRCLYGLDRAEEAVASLRQALDLAGQQAATQAQMVSLHNQLGQALRKAGDAEGAAKHFAEAKRLADERIETSRKELKDYLADSGEPDRGASAMTSDAHPLAEWPGDARRAFKARATEALARSYFNLGVLQAQRERYGRAAEYLEQAAALDPAFPQIKSSLAVAYFNAKRFDKAAEILAAQVAQDASDAALRRMLALAYVNAGAYDKATPLLARDPEVARDPSLQFTYGMALVRSQRAAEAEAVFARLLRAHRDWPEMHVLLGQAHADQGKYEDAIASLKRALELKADAHEANLTLGLVYLRQGRLADAEAALRAELKVNPGDPKAEYHLASVLDTAQRPDEAVPYLRHVLGAQPDSAEAHSLLGKILLARASAVEAAEHLEAAIRLAPEDASARYQLGRAYQKLGQMDKAKEQFEAFRELKAKQ